MKKTFAVSVVTAALIGLLLPTTARAETFTFACEPAPEAPPAEWFGGPWTEPLTVKIDTTNRTIEVVDQQSNVLGGSSRPNRLGRLNNHEMDIVINENVITWGINEMWGFSGYLDRKSGRVDLVWNNSSGYSPNTLNRQFHGTCRRR